MDTLVETFVEAGVSAGKKNIKKRINDIELRKSLSKYFEKKQVIIDLENLDVDFEGLIEYLRMDFCNDVEDALFCPDSQIRKNKRNYIASKAVKCSKADSLYEKKVVSSYVFKSIDIISKFYKKKIDKRYWLLRDDLIDGVRNVISEELDNKLDDLNKNYKSSNYDNDIVNLSHKGNYDGVEKKIHMIKEELSLDHPLYPMYGFEFVGEKMVSVPRTKEAIQKHPPKIILTGEMRMGNVIVSSFDERTIQYANSHQLDIKLSIRDAKKYLGDFEDPRQHEAEAYVGTELVLKPKPFPPAFPCKIIIDDTVFIEYVKLRTKEILDDGTVIVSNDGEDTSPFIFNIGLKIGHNNQNYVRFSMMIRSKSNSDHLWYSKMMQKASLGGNLQVYMIENQLSLIEGKMDKFNYKGGFASLEEEIDFLERIVEIEGYYETRIAVLNEINAGDYENVIHLSDLIRGTDIHKKWNDLSVELICSAENKEVIKSLENKKVCINCFENEEIPIFGKEYHVNVCCSFKSVKIKDYEGLRKKIDYMDEEDKIRIHFIAADDNTYIEVINNNASELDKNIIIMESVSDKNRP